jgi:hypothetical protein
MARQTVREIEARLAGSIEDRVSQRLGYREQSVRLPGGQIVEPRPLVKELNANQQKAKFSEQILTELSGSYRPATIWEVKIPRTYPPELIRVEGVWAIQSDGEQAVDCYPLSILRTDARWVVYLTPQRRGTLIP